MVSFKTIGQYFKYGETPLFSSSLFGILHTFQLCYLQESLDYVDFIDDSKLYDEYDDLINEHSVFRYF